MKRETFRQPRHGFLPWIFVLVGCLNLASGTVQVRGEEGVGVYNLLIGVGFILLGVADLLPRDRTNFAGLLRVASGVLCVASFLGLVAWSLEVF